MKEQLVISKSCFFNHRSGHKIFVCRTCNWILDFYVVNENSD